ncbi:MAG TPA: DUF2939 domain-containing protein [Longimicrobium sp.]|jgi:hypothetical protein
MRKSSYFRPFALLALCAASVWLYFTPHLAVRRLQAAAEAGDREALAQLVDFPSVRASVKEEVRQAMAERIDKEADDNPFARFGAALAGMMVDPLVDSFVTPGGIAAAVRGERPSVGKEGPDRAEKAARDVEVTRGYEGVDTFVLHFRGKDDGKERMALVMHREGLADWKLSAIRLPDGAE